MDRNTRIRLVIAHPATGVPLPFAIVSLLKRSLASQSESDDLIAQLRRGRSGRKKSTSTFGALAIWSPGTIS